MKLELILFFILIFFSILNLVFMLSISNFILKLAESISSLQGDIDDLIKKESKSKVINSEEKGLIDV
jgi:hypothetical protein